MRTLLIGSNNAHKAAEMRAILEATGLARILMPRDVEGFPTDIAETGATLADNALLKALAIARATRHCCVADDTGLEVDALGGAPGVHSARYASMSNENTPHGQGTHNAHNTHNAQNSSDAANRSKLLDALRDVPPAQRTARFRTVICLLDGSALQEAAPVFLEGVCEGMIALEERGDAGFGYDALFMPHGYSLTFAQMSEEQKNSISHRGQALTRLAVYLKQ
jgi:XTP/dITP diphosphohydrolase